MSERGEANIERMTLYRCPSCGLLSMSRYDDRMRNGHCVHRGDYFEQVLVVPAEQQAGAVEALQRIVDLPCPLGRDGDPLGEAQRIASEAITASGGGRT